MADHRALPEDRLQGRAGVSDKRMVTLPASALGELMGIGEGALCWLLARCEDGQPVPKQVTDLMGALEVAERAISEAR